MAVNYIKYTNDIQWLEKNIIFLKREIKFWRRKRFAKIEKYGEDYYLAYYAVEGHGPRPESYIEDMDLAAHLETEKEKEEIYSNIKSAAQSGWDFSSRWIYDEQGDSRANLSYTQAMQVSLSVSDVRRTVLGTVSRELSLERSRNRIESCTFLVTVSGINLI